MTSVRERRRRKKEEQARRAARMAAEGARGAAPLPRQPKQDSGRVGADTEPPAEQTSRKSMVRGQDGIWRNLDMIGVMYEDGFLTPTEEQAARAFQDLRAEYVAEHELRGYRSCLSDAGGHDNGDGDPDVFRRYRLVQEKIGLPFTSNLASEVFKAADEKPHLPGWTKAALKALAS